MAGKTLRQLDLARKTGVMIASISRHGQRIHIPGGDTTLFPADRIQIIGNDESIKLFSEKISTDVHPEITFTEDCDLVLRSITIEPCSPLCNKAVRDSRIREDYDCMLVGFEEPNGQIGLPQAHRIILNGERLWIVGEKAAIHRLFEETSPQDRVNA